MSQPGNGEGNAVGPVGTGTGSDGADLSPQQREAMYQAQGAGMSIPFGGIGQFVAQARAAGMNEQQIQKLSQDAEMLDGLSGSDQNYEGRQHAEMKGFVNTNLDPAQVNQMSETFSKVKGVLDRLSQRANESVGKARHEWEGDAAENAFGYFGQMSTWADSNATNSQLASEATYAQSGAAETAKNTMPEPVETNGLMKDFGAAVKDNPINPIGAFNEAMETREKSDAAHKEAVRVMNTYDQNLYQSASKQPAFSEPPTFAAGAGKHGGVGAGTGVIDIPGGDTTSASGFTGGPTGGGPVTGGGPTGGGGSYNGPSGNNPSVAPTPTPVAGRGPATGAGQLPGTGTQGNTPMGPRVPTTGGGTGFGGMGPAPVGPMAGGAAAGGSTPYNSKLGGRAGAAGFGPTGGGSAAGAAKGMSGAGGAGAAGGAAGPGAASGAKGMAGGTGAAAPGAAAAAGSGSGARGGAGMMGGAGAGRGQQGGDEEEHQRPSWLVEADPESLFGTDERTAPPVIGE